MWDIGIIIVKVVKRNWKFENEVFGNILICNYFKSFDNKILYNINVNDNNNNNNNVEVNNYNK